jgi:hypothetical protein
VAARIKAVTKKNGLDGQDGQVKHTPYSATSKVSTSSMASIYYELAANAALVLSGVACSLLERQVAPRARRAHPAK